MVERLEGDDGHLLTIGKLHNWPQIKRMLENRQASLLKSFKIPLHEAGGDMDRYLQALAFTQGQARELDLLIGGVEAALAEFEGPKKESEGK